MESINKKTLGLIVGTFAAGWHVIWLLLVGLGLAKPLLDWILNLHHLEFDYAIKGLNLGRGIMLVVVTFIGGYLSGWLLAAIWNYFKKDKTSQ